LNQCAEELEHSVGEFKELSELAKQTVTVTVDDLRDISKPRYWLIRNAYQALPWAQQCALKIVLDQEVIRIKELVEKRLCAGIRQKAHFTRPSGKRRIRSWSRPYAEP